MEDYHRHEQALACLRLASERYPYQLDLAEEYAAFVLGADWPHFALECLKLASERGPGNALGLARQYYQFVSDKGRGESIIP